MPHLFEFSWYTISIPLSTMKNPDSNLGMGKWTDKSDQITSSKSFPILLLAENLWLRPDCSLILELWNKPFSENEANEQERNQHSSHLQMYFWSNRSYYYCVFYKCSTGVLHLNELCKKRRYEMKHGKFSPKTLVETEVLCENNWLDQSRQFRFISS